MVLRRLSTRLVRSVLFAVIAVNLLVFSTLKLTDSFAVVSITAAPVSSTSKDAGVPAADTPKQAGFERRVAAQFADLEQNNKTAWMLSSSLTEVDFVLPIARFLKNAYEHSFETADSWLNQNQIFYDPRFTLSIYLSELTRKYAQAASGTERTGAKINLSSMEPVKLPFNWLDWMNLTALNSELEKPLDKRWTCSTFKEQINNRPNPGYFCRDTARMTGEDVVRMGFRSKNQLPGIAIYAHAKHDDRAINDIRVYQAKNHAFTQNLDTPARVIILNGDEGTVEFEVDKTSRDRIITSDLVHNYLQYNGFALADITPEALIHFNHLETLDRMKQKLKFKTIKSSEDPAGMHQLLHYSRNRELTLTEDMFDYSEAAVEEWISEYEERGLSSLKPHEYQFYKSMRYCVDFEVKNEPEYFKMAVIEINDPKNKDKDWGWHYDWRFFAGALNYNRPGWTQRQLTLRTQSILDRLLRNWQRFCFEKGLVNWIMHGPLLSWFWNGQMFPYDIDVDVQMPISELLRLARDFNQTLVVEDPQEGYGKFFLDVSPFIHRREINEKTNYIDARFIDVDSGIYIDITGLSKSKATPPKQYKASKDVKIEKPPDSYEVEVYNDRRKHFYTLEQLSPLRYTMLSGTPVFVPSHIVSRLEFEYSSGLNKHEYDGWYFCPRLNMWVTQEQLLRLFRDVKDKNGKVEVRRLLNKVHAMSNSEALKLLKQENDLLIEYYLTKRLSDYHTQEKEIFFDKYGHDAQVATKKLKTQYAELTSGVTFGKPVRKALYDFEHFEKPRHDKR